MTDHRHEDAHGLIQRRIQRCREVAEVHEQLAVGHPDDEVGKQHRLTASVRRDCATELTTDLRELESSFSAQPGAEASSREALRERLKDHAAVVFVDCSLRQPERGHCWACEAALDMLEAAAALPAPQGEQVRAQIEYSYRVADAWRQGAMDAGNAQPMNPERRDMRKVAAPYVAAYEMGYGFIHRSPVAMEMTGRINSVAGRCSQAERELAELRAASALPDEPRSLRSGVGGASDGAEPCVWCEHVANGKRAHCPTHGFAGDARASSTDAGVQE